MNNTMTSVRQPLLWWMVVLTIATLSFYVHLLNEHVARGAQLRDARHAALQRPSAERFEPQQVTRTAQR